VNVWTELHTQTAPWFLRIQSEIGPWCHYPRDARGTYKRGRARETSSEEVRAYLLRVAQIVRDALSERDLGADAIRQACGISKFTLSNILRGKKVPSLETIVRLARAMNLSPSELMP
jgi:DNA-binding XRE family transcriptional regulator